VTRTGNPFSSCAVVVDTEREPIGVDCAVAGVLGASYEGLGVVEYSLALGIVAVVWFRVHTRSGEGVAYSWGAVETESFITLYS